MIDLERLDEALEWWESHPETDPMSDKLHRVNQLVFVEAARAYRDLANGEQVEWCEVHRCDYDAGRPGCPVWMTVKQGGGPARDCRIVSRIVVDVVEEG